MVLLVLSVSVFAALVVVVVVMIIDDFVGQVVGMAQIDALHEFDGTTAGVRVPYSKG